MNDMKSNKPSRPPRKKLRFSHQQETTQDAQPKDTGEKTVHRMVDAPKQPEHKKQPIQRLKTYWVKASRNKKIAIIASASAVILLLGFGVAHLLQPSPTERPAPVITEPKEEKPPEPTTVTSELTGLQVDPKRAKLPVTAVTIENSPDARPQSGLADAGVVFESMIEGSITRFLALYQEEKASHIGPIRSVRRNHIDWLLSFDAALAHVGGSPFALQRLRTENVKDLDQFNNPEAYHRTNARFAPHNMYSSRGELLKVHKKRGYNSSSYNGFVRKRPKPAEKPDATEVNVNISRPQYNVRFAYNKASNAYKRFMGGVPHVDERTNKQIVADVVVVIIADYHKDGIYSVYQRKGSGTAFIFQDGSVIQGTWEKRNKKENYRFGDKNGSPIGLNPGKTWITLATNKNEVSVKP